MSDVARSLYNVFMICPNCGYDNPATMVFCGMCGTQIAQGCSNCHSLMPLDFRFCGTCGANLTAGEKTISDPEREDHKPFSLSDPMNHQEKKSPPKSPLVGELRQVTVIVADVKGSSKILEALGSESWVEEMNAVLQIMGNAIYQFGGEVDQFRGDGMVAFFGARSTHEDDPERGIMASLTLKAQIQKYGEIFKENYKQDLSVRIGINTGEVITANIGNRETHSEETAMGGAITLAARLESAAEPGSILVSGDTYRIVSNRFNWESLGEIKLKGLVKPVSVYRPLSPIFESEQRHRLQAYGFSIPLTGRDKELNAIVNSIQELKNQRGGILMVRGEAGMGKSRLIFESRQQIIRDEALKSSDASQLIWLQGRCRSYDHTHPYSMWVDLIQRWLGDGQWISQELALENLEEKVYHYWGEQQHEYFQFLATFLALPLDEIHGDLMHQPDSESLRHRFFQVIYRWLDVLSHQDPLVIVFQEVHWADQISLDLLKYCLPLCTIKQILFIVVYRPERNSAVWDFQYFVETEYHHKTSLVALETLPIEKSREFLEQMVGIGTLPTSLRDQILYRAAGNPYYLTELVRSLVDKQVLVQDPENQQWQLISEDVHLEIPTSLKSLLFTRIDSLTPDQRHTLQMASAIGPIFWFEVLKSITDPEHELGKQLIAMQRAQLITERGLLPGMGREYAFQSTLIQEAAYDSILNSQRAGIHLSIASFIEQTVQSKVLKHYHGIIAYHFRKAGHCQKELFHTLLEAENLKKLYANYEAIQAYNHIIEVLEQENGWECTTPDRIIDEWRLETLKGLGEIYFGIGKISEAEKHLREAVSLARMMKLDPRSLARVFYWLGEVLFWKGRYEEAIHLGEEGLYRLGDDNQNTEAALMNQLVAVGSSQLGDHQRFVEYTSRTADFINTLPYASELRPAYDHIIVLFAYTNKDLVQTQKWLDIFQDWAESNHDLRALGEVFWHTATIAFRRGNTKSSVDYFQKAIHQFEKIGDVKHMSRALRSFGISYLQLGNLDEADQCFDKDIKSSGTYKNDADYALGYWYKAQVQLCRGNTDQAQILFKKAIEYSKSSLVFRDVWAFISFGRINMVQGNQQEVRDTLKFSFESNPMMVVQNPYQALSILSKLEQSHDQFSDFQRFIDSYRQRHPEVQQAQFSQWHLTPGEITPPDHEPLIHEYFNSNLDKSWDWINPFNDCEYTLKSGLTIYSVNERNLHHINHSAPRMLYKEAIIGDFTVQIRCSRGKKDRPAIGGLLVWQSNHYWFCFETGSRGYKEVTLRGYHENYDQVFGRGQLDADQRYLRLERRGSNLSAFCSGNGNTWWYAGRAELSTTSPISVGIHGIGHINRMIYPGAYPDGTAIRFDELCLWNN